eukprot:TRINITY_DN2956_c0_g1_i2.p1 TRINITY_DN2956_c0_g1~~TRINITY_DN2956_c0_g1_i2.p1  ORF type:complete len:115 (+),score=13.93 TRINITY_DN2956_c0_g1_i2:54-398(+)
MKFSKQLASNQVIEWQTKYIDYKGLKRILKSYPAFKRKRTFSIARGIRKSIQEEPEAPLISPPRDFDPPISASPTTMQEDSLTSPLLVNEELLRHFRPALDLSLIHISEPTRPY